MEATHAFRFDYQMHEVPFFTVIRGQSVPVFVKQRRARYGRENGDSRIGNPVRVDKTPHIPEILFLETAVDDEEPHQMNAVFLKHPDGLNVERLGGMLLIGVQKAVGNRLQADHDVTEAGLRQFTDQVLMNGDKIRTSVADKGLLDIPLP